MFIRRPQRLCSVETPSAASASSSREASLPLRPCPPHPWCTLLNRTALLRGEPTASVGLYSSSVGKLRHNQGPQLCKYTLLNQYIGPITSKWAIIHFIVEEAKFQLCKPCLPVVRGLCVSGKDYGTITSGQTDKMRPSNVKPLAGDKVESRKPGAESGPPPCPAPGVLVTGFFSPPGSGG